MTLPNHTQALQFAQLQKVLATMYADRAHVPKLIGPDTNGFSDAVKFLKQAQGLGIKMHGITYHEWQLRAKPRLLFSASYCVCVLEKT